MQSQGSEELTQHDLYEEYIMLGLRSRGLKFKRGEKPGLLGIGSEAWYMERKQIINQLVAAGKMVIDGDWLKLTRDGFLFCDEIVDDYSDFSFLS
ncbi:MAG: hypothetical protein IPG53_11415 [Ignavibacteriales bacterium]|nr:hypothetical protein [Ignavibacteriales bacterium]